mgnify:CR=1 FL=1
MVALVDNQMTVIAHDVIDLAIPNQALDQRHINDPCRFPFPATEDADLLCVDAQEGTQTLYPLGEKLPAVNKNQRVAAPMRYEHRCDNCLAEGGRGGKHAVIVGDKSIKGPRLWRAKHPLERDAGG